MSDQAPNSGCPTETLPTFMSTSAVVDPTGPVVASPFISFQVCKENARILIANDNSLIYIESIDYRVQFIQLSCHSPE